MKKNKQYFFPLIIFMVLFLLIVSIFVKFSSGEYVVLICWLFLCGKNVHGYFFDGRMFAFSSSDIKKGEKDPEGRVVVFLLTLVLYFSFITIALFKNPWRNFFTQ
jgi:hypothetical protein